MATEENARRSSVEDDNNWRRITDAGERRRAQNRIAQRNYRRNVKLRQQQLDQVNETLTSRSQVLIQKQAARLNPASSDAASNKTSSESSYGKAPTTLESSTQFHACWQDVIGTSQFLPEIGINTEDLESLSLIPSTQESCPAVQDNSEADCMARWIYQQNDSGLITSSMARVARLSDSTPLNALQRAILRGQTSVVKLLAENGANVYVVDEHGNNILHLAVQSGIPSLVLFALKNGIDINDKNLLGHTPLHVAIECEDLEIIKLLLGAGADMEIKS